MSTLTDRYVHATTRAVPEPQREELARELRGEIAEMVGARVDAGEPPADAERATLTELGQPERLAATYTQTPLQLLGPAYYLVWKALLIMLLTWVPGIVALLSGGATLLDGDDLGAAAGDAALAFYVTTVMIAFWVTVVFVLVERYGKPTDLPSWSVDDLREVPDRPRAFGRTQLAGALVVGLLQLGLLVWQALWGVVDGTEYSDGRGLPVIDEGSWLVPALLAAILIEMGLAVAAYRRGSWSWPLAATAIVVELAAAVSIVWLLLADRFFDPRLIASQDFAAPDVRTASVALAAAIVVGTAWEVAGRARAAARGARATRADAQLPKTA